MLQAVETRQQRFGQRRWDCGRTALATAAGENAARQLLREQRHAVGARHDLVDDGRRQRFRAGQALDQPAQLGRRQAVETQHRDVRLVLPGRGEFRPGCGHDQGRSVAHHVNDHAEKLDGRGVGPLHVLDHQHRRAAEGRLGEIEQGLQRSRARIAGLDDLRRGRAARIDAQEVEHGRQTLERSGADALQQDLELVVALACRVLGGDARGILQLVDHGKERRLLLVRRALQHEPAALLGARDAVHFLDQARLAEARLTHHQDDLAGAGLCGGQPVANARKLALAADQDGGAPRAHGVIAADDRALARDSPRRHRFGHALQLEAANVDAVEKIADEGARALGDDQLVGPRQALDARGKIGRLAGDVDLLGRAAFGHVADNDQAGRHADADLRRRAGDGFELAKLADDGETGAQGALGVLFQRMGVAEIDEHAVADIVGDEASVALHRFGDAGAIGRQQLVQILGVEARRQRRGIDQVAKHHGDLPALGYGRASAGGLLRHGGRCGCCGLRHFPRRRRLAAECCDRLEHAAAVADGLDADLLQILGREERQRLEINVVGEKRLAISREAEPLEPLVDAVRHRPRPPTSWRDRRRVGWAFSPLPRPWVARPAYWPCHRGRARSSEGKRRNSADRTSALRPAGR